MILNEDFFTELVDSGKELMATKSIPYAVSQHLAKLLTAAEALRLDCRNVDVKYDKWAGQGADGD